jgi:SAM-dependent methyltransferase
MSKTSEGAAWFEEWFDRDEYEVVYRRRDEQDALRLLALIQQTTNVKHEARVLDMACGRGRHAKLLAERGFRVTGVDLSPQAIKTAQEMASRESLDIEFEVGDMRETKYHGRFDLVVNLFTSFGYFDKDEENARAVQAMSDSLVEGGWLVQDFMNGQYWSTNFVPYDERSEGDFHLKQRRWVERGRLNKEITIVGGNGVEQKFIESVRLFGIDDFHRMHTAAGLRVEQVFGDPDGTAYGPLSRRLIVFSRRV